jgi:hypothetical protein
MIIVPAGWRLGFSDCFHAIAPPPKNAHAEVSARADEAVVSTATDTASGAAAARRRGAFFTGAG